MSQMKFSIQPELGTLSERDSKRYFSTIGLSAVVLIVVSNLSAILLQIILELAAPDLLNNAWVQQLLSSAPLYLIGFPCAYLVLRRLPKGFAPSEPLEARKIGVGFCVTFALMMLGSYVGNFIILMLESALGRSLTNPVESATVGQTWWINLIFVGILAPIVEEIFFRRAVCNRLLVLGEGYTIVLSAAFFGLAHGNLFQFFYAFLLGAFFALIYVKTGRIRYSIGYHILVNVLGGVFSAWVVEQIAPLLEEEAFNHLFELMESADPTELLNFIDPYLLPLVLLAIYNVFLMVVSICGLVFILRERKKIRLQEGLLPPMREGRVANVFCNGGVAAALTVFLLLFLLSMIAV